MFLFVGLWFSLVIGVSSQGPGEVVTKTINVPIFLHELSLAVKGEDYLSQVQRETFTPFRITVKRPLTERTYSVPSECDASALTKNNVVCINSQTGNIYISSWTLDQGPLFNNTIIEATVASDRGDVVQDVINLVIRFSDTVCPTDPTVKVDDIVTGVDVPCGQYIKSLTLQPQSDNIATFPVTPDIVEIVGFQFDSQPVKSVQLIFEISRDEGNEQLIYATKKVDYELVGGPESLQNVYVNLDITYKENDIITVQVIDKKSESETPVRISIFASRIFFINSWKMCLRKDPCLESFRSNQEFIKNCQLPDPGFIGSYERCLDLKPVLTGSYSESNHEIFCDLSSSAPDLGMSNDFAYVAVNETISLPALFLRRKRRSLQTTQMTSSWIAKADYVMVNSKVRCAVHEPLRMKAPVFSAPIFVNITYPYFLRPSVESMSGFIGAPLTIPGFQFVSPLPRIQFDKLDFSWLKDGKTKIPVTNLTLTKTEPLTYEISPLAITEIKTSDAGSYQCVSSKLEIKSSPIQVLAIEVTTKTVNLPLYIGPFERIIEKVDYLDEEQQTLSPFEISANGGGDGQYDAPLNCDGKAPRTNVVCIDPQNGDIYMTNWRQQLVERQMLTVVQINATVKTKGISQPIVNLRIRFSDSVCPAEEKHVDISQLVLPMDTSCLQYVKHVSLKQESNLIAAFTITVDIGYIIGFSFFSKKDWKSVQIRFSVPTGDKYTVDHEIVNTFGQSQSVPLQNFVKTREQQTVIVQIFNKNAPPGEVYPLPIINSTIAYITSWKMCRLDLSSQTRCLKSYDNARTFIKNCKLIDPQFLGSYERCYEPYFLPLQVSKIQGIMGAAFQIPGCKFIFPSPSVVYNNSHVFWLKDGQTKIPVKSNLLTSKTESFVNYTFPPLLIPNLKATDIGKYVCVVQTNLNRFSSPQISLETRTLTVSKASISLNEVEGRVMLSCVIKASWPPNKVYWVHNGVKRMAQLSAGDGSGEGPTGGLKPGFIAGENLDGSQESILKDFVFDLEITGYIQLGRYSCGVFDEDFMAEKIESNPLEVYYPGPTFTSSPSILNYRGRGYEGRFSSDSDIKGCQFSSKFPLVPGENVYWLKDGYKNMSLNSIQKGKMSNLYIGIPPVNEMGYYQCAIFIPGYTKQHILSQAASVQIANSTSAKLSIRLAWDWKEQYLNRTSKEFQSLENALGNELSRAFRYPSIVVLNVRKGSVIVDVRVSVSTPVEDRMKACDLRVEATSFVEITALSIDIQSLDCCPSVAFGESEYKGEYSFPKALTGRSVSQRCKYNDANETVSAVSRKCLSDLQNGPRWGDADFSKCNAKFKTTQDLISLSNTPICTTDSEGCSPVVDVAENLTQTVTNGTQLQIYQDVELTATTIANVVNALNYTNQTEQVVADVLQTVNSVLEAEVQIVADAQIKEMSSTKILQSLDKLVNEVRKVLSNETTFAVNKPNIALRLQQVDRSDVTLLASPTANDTVEISFTNTSVFNATPMDLVVIQIPSEAFNSSSDIVHSYFFKQNSLFLTEREIVQRLGRQGDGGLVVQSNVLSATVGDGKVENLSTPIILTFKKTKVLDSLGNDTCQFWNPSIETIVKGVFGKWSDNGCRLYAEGLNNDEFTSCQCDHLTNFALLLDMNQNAENPLELQIVTWIGCGISLAGLFLTVLTYSVFPNIRKKLAPKILICLCMSLIGLLVSFLAGAEQTEPRVGCQIVAGVIHFFMLSTFCWMLVEAANLYKSFVMIFNKMGYSDKNLFTKANLFGWGVPAIIVIVTGAVRPEELGNYQICVIRGHPFYFAVVLPVCLILLFNFIVLGMTMYSLTHRGHQLEKKDRNYYKNHARIAFTCASLLGLSWLFGLLAVWDMTMVFQWIFCITTSLQGLFIFIFYTIRNKDVQKEWTRCIRPNNKNDTMSSSSGQPTSNNRTHQTQLDMNSLSRSTPNVY